jgi:urease accessory protein
MTQLRVTTPYLGTTARRAALMLALLAPTAALAHPGHGGGFLPGLLHPFHGLDHLLAAVAVGIWGTKVSGRGIWALPAAFVTAMLAGGVLGRAGIVLPAAEIMIALSVLLLGLALLANARVSLPAAAAAVAVFALFHGGAHGAEAPADTGYALYALGLIAATLALHLSGVAAALALRARPLVLRLAAAPIAVAGLALVAARLG